MATTKINQAALALAPGARVEVRDEEWVVRSVRKAFAGGYAVHLTGISELVRGRDSIFLSGLDRVKELAPEKTTLVADSSPGYSRTRLYLESLIRRTSPPAGDARIFLGHQAAIDPANYQLQPAVKALRQPRPRILMADGVGLGKTIEVGILLTELIERGRGDRILVVALKSVLAQFQEELWARFTIPLVRLDSVGLRRVQSRIPSSMNPFHYYDRVIISMDTLKDAKYRRYLEEIDDWDVIVVDECQNVAVRTKSTALGGGQQHSQRAGLAQLLARTCEALIFTSATPHDGSPQSFASLMNLLEPTAIADPDDYTHEDVADLFMRRFKKDIAHEVADAFRERKIDPRKTPASASEDAVFSFLRELEFQTIARSRNSKGVLFRTTLLKSFLSSPAACAATVQNRFRHKDLQAEDDPAAAHDRDHLTRLQHLLDAITPDHFQKYQRLLTLLREQGFHKKRNTERIVIFSERMATLGFLKQRLLEDLGLKKDQIEVFYGTLDDQSQKRIVQSFGTEDSAIRVLLASDAAAEGLNLHYFCHRLLHFDLPWSLITLEQRNGRVDRYGQKQQPVLTYLLTIPGDPASPGDLRVLERLIEKEDMAQKNLGDVAWLMNLHDAEKEEERIARSIEDGEDPEEVIPEKEEPTDFLSILMGTGETTDEPAERTSDPSLYADEVAYCLDAFDVVLADQPDLVEYHEHLQGFTLHAPTDLEHRLDYLPPELRQVREGGATVFKLTADRQRVMDALEESRKHKDRWPEWQLLWEQHPVCEWLDDAVIASFQRHEAPVVEAARGLEADEVVVLVQGVLSNERGQPTVVDWFGVSLRDGQPGEARPLSSLIVAVGLDRPLANPGKPLSEVRQGALSAMLPAAVQFARERMRQLRLERMETLSAPLRQGLTKLTVWRNRRLQAIDAQRARFLEEGRTVPVLKNKQLDSYGRETRKVFEQRERWINESLRTNRNPYVRVAAVLTPSS